MLADCEEEKDRGSRSQKLINEEERESTKSQT
jgi:hypothetical protein